MAVSTLSPVSTQTFVPISMVVSLDLVKVFQGMFIMTDNEMVALETNIRTTVNTSNLNEELGQIEYIFSDKTGTLTKNLMEFKNLCVNGIGYGKFAQSINII